MLTKDNFSRELNAMVENETAKAWVEGFLIGLIKNAGSTYFTVELYDVKSKIRAIKAVREQTNLGLKEAKRLVESANGTIYITRDYATARNFVDALENIGEQAYIGMN